MEFFLVNSFNNLIISLKFAISFLLHEAKPMIFLVSVSSVWELAVQERLLSCSRGTFI